MSILIFIIFISCQGNKATGDNSPVKTETEEESEIIEDKTDHIITSDVMDEVIAEDSIVDKNDYVPNERTFKAPKVENQVKVEKEKANQQNSKVKEKKATERIVKSVPKIEKKGKLSFQNKIFDFGFIEIGEVIDHSFYFTNTGNKDVVISNATATCGCTTPVYPFIPIEPGKTSKIDIRFNSKGRLGNQIATVKIISDAEESIQELTIKGVVRAEIVSPSEFIDTIKE